MPLEASGKDWFEFAYGDDWKTHAGYFATDHAKVLIRDNPALSVPDRLQQAERLKVVSAWAAETRHHLIVELLVPATDDDLRSVGGDKKRYDDELRPKLTLEVIGFLQDHGADPAIWKVEGMDTHGGCGGRRRPREARRAHRRLHHPRSPRVDGGPRPLAGGRGPACRATSVSRSAAASGGTRWPATSPARSRRMSPSTRSRENYLGFAHAYLDARGAAAS